MTLHLTRDEADRLTADGRVVLFREGVYPTPRPGLAGGGGPTVIAPNPPAEFVEAAQACETCEGHGYLVHPEDGSSEPCDDDCLDGKRRIAAVVPCRCVAEPDGPYKWGPCNGTGLVTVGHVVVEWGPTIVVLDQEDVGSAYEGPACVEINPTTGYARYWPSWSGALEYEDGLDIALSPDIDPQSLPGQYGLGVKKAAS